MLDATTARTHRATVRRGSCHNLSARRRSLYCVYLPPVGTRAALCYMQAWPREKLLAYKVPQRILVVKRLPTAATVKVLKHKLLSLLPRSWRHLKPSSAFTTHTAQRRARDAFHRCGRGQAQRASNRPAAPMPPPTHMVHTMYFAARRLPSSKACPTRRAPDIP